MRPHTVWYNFRTPGLPSNCKGTTWPESHGHGSVQQREGGKSRPHGVQKKTGELELKGQMSPPTNGNKGGEFSLTKADTKGKDCVLKMLYKHRVC